MRFSDASSTIASQPRHLKRQSETLYSNDTRLVITSDVNQRAADICADAASLGPDLFNVVEGQFCQMSSKTLYPVCDAAVTDNCFNGDTQKLVIGGISTRDEQYSRVIDHRDFLEDTN